MKPTIERPSSDLSISSGDFDRLMRKALQVAPEDAPKPKKTSPAKPKAQPAKKHAPKK